MGAMVDELERGANLRDHYMIAVAHRKDLRGDRPDNSTTAAADPGRQEPRPRLPDAIRRLFRR
jgi:hypothetical protein